MLDVDPAISPTHHLADFAHSPYGLESVRCVLLSMYDTDCRLPTDELWIARYIPWDSKATCTAHKILRVVVPCSRLPIPKCWCNGTSYPIVFVDDEYLITLISRNMTLTPRKRGPYVWPAEARAAMVFRISSHP